MAISDHLMLQSCDVANTECKCAASNELRTWPRLAVGHGLEVIGGMPIGWPTHNARARALFPQLHRHRTVLSFCNIVEVDDHAAALIAVLAGALAGLEGELAAGFAVGKHGLRMAHCWRRVQV